VAPENDDENVFPSDVASDQTGDEPSDGAAREIPSVKKPFKPLDAASTSVQIGLGEDSK